MKRLFLTAVALGLGLSLSAQSWLPLKAEADAKGSAFQLAPVICLMDSTGVEVSQTGSGSFTIHKVMLINSPEGAMANRVIKYDYDPLTAYAEFGNVLIYRASGSIDTIPATSALDYAAPARAIYWGARQIMIEPGRLSKGDVLDYTITKKGFTYALLGSVDDEERFVPPMRGEFYDIVPFWVSEPTVSKIYKISVPKDKNVQYEFYQGDCRSSVRVSGDRKILSFEVHSALPFVPERNMVDLFDVAPKLMMSSTDSWTEKSLWFNKVNEDYGSFDAYEPAQRKVNELLKGVTDEMQKISILTHWVADNIRYSGISMGKGEGYTLHNCKMDYTDRCGVCKDKAGMLISMLRMAGLKAYPAMTMAGSRIESIPADHFNHCVVVVKLSNGTYMPLDPTWVPFSRELWSSAEQQQNYLPGIPEGSDLCITPVSAPENHYFKIDANTSVSADGTLKGSFTVRAEGLSDASVRRPFTTGAASRVQQAIETELLKVSPAARMISYKTVNSPADYQKGPISITVNFEIPDYATVADGMISCKPLVMTNLYSGVRTFLRFATDEQHNYAFKDACSRLVVLNETMTAPKGYKLTDGASDFTFTGAAASCNANISAKNNTAVISNTLRMEKRVYEATDWSDVKNALTGYHSIDKCLTFEKR